jgi:hypothetical protein
MYIFKMRQEEVLALLSVFTSCYAFGVCAFSLFFDLKEKRKRHYRHHCSDFELWETKDTKL